VSNPSNPTEDSDANENNFNWFPQFFVHLSSNQGSYQPEHEFIGKYFCYGGQNQADKDTAEPSVDNEVTEQHPSQGQKFRDNNPDKEYVSVYRHGGSLLGRIITGSRAVLLVCTASSGRGIFPFQSIDPLCSRSTRSTVAFSG
jgi:hypothetical protein